jgi:protein phosphatase
MVLERFLVVRLRVGASTDTGRVRDLNEDVFVLRAEDGLFVVCDGMGGAPAGEVASRLAADAIVRRIDEARGHGVVTGDEREYLPHTTLLAEAVRRSNAMIYDRARQDPARAGMGTTVVTAWIRQHIAGVAHVGDSRAYLWHGGRLEPLTRDHSLAEARLTAGLAPDDGAACEQNVLVRVLGREPDVDVELNEVPVQPGDYVLLCSDGLTRMLSERVLADAIVRLREPQQICDYLIGAANDRGGADNITVVVVEVAGGRWRRLWERWTRSARGHDAEAYAAV